MSQELSVLTSKHSNLKLNVIDKSKNKNTTKATVTWMSVYHTWAKHRGEVLKIEKVEPKNLTKFYFLRNFTELKNQDGQDWEPNSLRSIQASMDRYLHERGYTHSILKSREFSSSKTI